MLCCKSVFRLPQLLYCWLSFLIPFFPSDLTSGILSGVHLIETESAHYFGPWLEWEFAVPSCAQT